MSDYEKYQLQWMIDHDCSLNDLIEELDYVRNDFDDGDRNSIASLYDIWEREYGFAGRSIWACEAEWEDSGRC